MTALALRAIYEAAPELDDVVEGAIFMFRSTGSSIEEVEGKMRVTLYFDDESGRNEALSYLATYPKITLEKLDQEIVDWLEIYEQSLDPLLVGDRWIVAARHDLIEETGGRVALVIPQERAFGTGSHASTALCLKLIERHLRRGSRCLDLGAGTGILAIAALKAGARSALAVEIDPLALGSLRRNGLVNRVWARGFDAVIGSIGTISPEAAFGLITMNILPHVIIPLLGEVRGHLETGGLLIISGVIEREIPAVRAAAAESGLELVDELREGEWWAAALSR